MTTEETLTWLHKAAVSVHGAYLTESVKLIHDGRVEITFSNGQPPHRFNSLVCAKDMYRSLLEKQVESIKASMACGMKRGSHRERSGQKLTRTKLRRR